MCKHIKVSLLLRVNVFGKVCIRERRGNDKREGGVVGWLIGC